MKYMYLAPALLLITGCAGSKPIIQPQRPIEKIVVVEKKIPVEQAYKCINAITKEDVPAVDGTGMQSDAVQYTRKLEDTVIVCQKIVKDNMEEPK